MSITQTFYNNLAAQYDKFFLDWQSATHEQALVLDKLFQNNGFDNSANILDCACGIGTQAIGLAALGYNVTASDISGGAIVEAEKRAMKNNVRICFHQADFCTLSETFSEKFDVVIAMDNALPHMLSSSTLDVAIKSIVNQVIPGGMFVASIRDYDSLLTEKPPYSSPYIHRTNNGQRVSFQTWEWIGEHYKLTQYIIDDEKTLQVSKFECEYRATRREEITKLLFSYGCSDVVWKFPDETGFYQPIVVAKK